MGETLANYISYTVAGDSNIHRHARACTHGVLNLPKQRSHELNVPFA